LNKEESLNLYNKGRETWNAWAKEMLTRQDVYPSKGNNATQDWHTSATADFSGHTFKDDTTFSGFLFPGDAEFTTTKFLEEASFEEAMFSGDALFVGATFSGEVEFQEAKFSGEALFEEARFGRGASFSEVTFTGNAWFMGTRFSGAAEFWGATFGGGTGFSGARFSGGAEFWEATFGGDVLFDEASFRDEAEFSGATFGGGAGFSGARFGGEAGFWEARFSGTAWFEGATFSGEAEFREAKFNGETGFRRARFGGDAGFSGARFGGDAGFNQAIFESFTDFSGTIYQKEANFVAIKGQSAFTLQEARFSVVPDFRQAHFEEAPQLDNARFHDNKSRLLRDQDLVSVKKDVSARWRALKRLATQGHDHERELDFLANEIKSLRGAQDRGLPNPLNLLKGKRIWLGGGRYWFGLFYQLFSDFGRSTFRPFFAWATLTFAFVFFYFSQHSVALNQICEPYLAAIHLSIHNGLVIPGLGRSEMLEQSYACLYGTGEEDQAVRYAVVFAGLGQTMISTILIFLFLLGLRNYFRIK
jgi:hypothetical protein